LACEAAPGKNLSPEKGYVNMIGSIYSMLKLSKFKIMWRKRNSHNFTTATNLFDPEKVSVGKYSYGPLCILSWNAPGENLTIGHFVSIASGVRILLGGSHRIDTFSTYPFRVKFFGEPVEAITKGPIVINDDAWICTNALILSGVTIGQGAVVAAGSVVTKNVPPYAVVAGNPARIVKFRFSQEIINRLMSIDFSKIVVSQLRALELPLYMPLTGFVLDEITSIIKDPNRE
jgi:virginiamycin A acetyltransferase